MMSNLLILEQDYQLLQSLIGHYVAYAVLPDLEISHTHFSNLTSLGINTRFTFYHASPISFYITNGTDWKNSFWLALDAGPDSADEPWAPFAAWKIAEPITACLFGEIRHPNGWAMEEQETDKRPARLELWSGSPVKSITIYRLGEYAAMTCSHEDGLTWSAYAEYDREFWLSFDREVAEAIAAESDDRIIIQ